MFEQLASPHLKGLVAYSPRPPIEQIEVELDIGGVAKLDSNENPLGPSPRAIRAIRDAVRGSHRYPDGGGRVLKRALADKFDLEPQHFILGNGSCELIDLCARCFLGPEDEAVIAEPSFIVYRRTAALTGCRLLLVSLKAHCHDLARMAAQVSPRTAVVFVGNPNNPTGTCVEPKEIDAFMERVPEDVVVLFDEAYYEYMPEEMKPDTLRYVREGRSVLVLRSFSKVYGLAGLRIGYGMAPPRLVETLDLARQPFNVNALAQTAASAALDDVKHLSKSQRLNEAGKEYLYEQFQTLGLAFIPTAANFILVDVGKEAGGVAENLVKKGVLVQPMGRYGFRTHIRVTTGTLRENERFISALREVLEPFEALPDPPRFASPKLF